MCIRSSPVFPAWLMGDNGGLIVIRSSWSDVGKRRESWWQRSYLLGKAAAACSLFPFPLFLTRSLSLHPPAFHPSHPFLHFFLLCCSLNFHLFLSSSSSSLSLFYVFCHLLLIFLFLHHPCSSSLHYSITFISPSLVLRFSFLHPSIICCRWEEPSRCLISCFAYIHLQHKLHFTLHTHTWCKHTLYIQKHTLKFCASCSVHTH